ncbi:hypothetical protein AAG906_006182 [Vitis piasezkii]
MLVGRIDLPPKEGKLLMMKEMTVMKSQREAGCMKQATPLAVAVAVAEDEEGKRKRSWEGSRTIERDTIAESEKPEDDTDMHTNNDNQSQNPETRDNGAEPEESKENISVVKNESKENISVGKNADSCVRNFDLNVDLDENGDSTSILPAAPAPAPAPVTPSPKLTEMKHEEYPGWSLSDMEKMEIDPIQLANLNRRIDEDEEDYDEE